MDLALDIWSRLREYALQQRVAMSVRFNRNGKRLYREFQTQVIPGQGVRPIPSISRL